jgi:hypothetical protein
MVAADGAHAVRDPAGMGLDAVNDDEDGRLTPIRSSLALLFPSFSYGTPAHNGRAGLDAQCKVKFDSANSIESTCNAPKTAGRLRRGALRAHGPGRDRAYSRIFMWLTLDHGGLTTGACSQTLDPLRLIRFHREVAVSDSASS